MLAVKPEALATAAAELAGTAAPSSRCSGRRRSRNCREALAPARVLRTMPNVARRDRPRRDLPRAADPATPTSRRRARAARRIARLHRAPREPARRGDGVMGCAGAYMALACEALIDAGIDAGLDAELSERLVARDRLGHRRAPARRMSPTALPRRSPRPAAAPRPGSTRSRRPGGRRRSTAPSSPR